MKMRIASLSLLAVMGLTLAAVPALAGDIGIGLLYDNGPLNGTTYAWQVNDGFVVADSFVLLSSSTITSVKFGFWVSSGDMPSMVELLIGSSPFRSDIGSFNALTTNFLTTYHGNAALCPAGCDVYISTFTIPGGGISVPGGTWWLTLQNVTTVNNGWIGWDQNSGVGCGGTGGGANCPSLAEDNVVGPIPSEDPDIYGYVNGATTPEPGSLVLFASGIAALAAIFCHPERRL